jgi:glycosyltransferase involved in cell wall biosynthesis
MSHSKTTLIAATLNEIETAPITLPMIRKEWVDEILICDGGSTDGTVEWCRKHGYTVLDLHGGYGAALKEAVARSKGDIIIEYQIDGNSLPETIPVLIAKIVEGYDFVVASRYKDGAKSYDDDALTAIGNWGFTTLTNLLFSTSYTDVCMGYRAYRKSAFNALKDDMTVTGLSWPIQANVQFARHGFRITEVGSDEPKRVGGERKMKPFKTGWEILTLLLSEYRKRNRPCTQKSPNAVAVGTRD